MSSIAKNYDLNDKQRTTFWKKLFIFLFALALSASATQAQALDSGLIGLYPFAGNAHDVSGYGNNGIASGATLTTDRFGHPNNAYSFDGSGQITINHTNNYNFTKFSASIWVKAISRSTGYGIIYKGNWPSNGWIFFDNSNTYPSIDFRVMPGNTENAVSIPSSQLNDNTWHHLAITYDSITSKLYFDGNLASSSSCSSFINSTNNLSIGGGLIGKVDDIRIYNRALSATEVQALYHDSTFYLATVALLSPSNRALNVDTLNTFKWSKDSLAINYRLQVARDSLFTRIIKNQITSDTGFTLTTSLKKSTKYYWRVKTYTANDSSDWSDTWKFKTLGDNLEVGLIAYYPFDGNANDESGNGNNGTVSGATLTEDRFGNTNSAYSFNSANQNYIEVPDAPSLHLTQNLTISVWLKHAATCNLFEALVMKGRDTYGFQLNYSTTPTILFHLYDSNWRNLSAIDTLQGDLWYNAVGTYDGTTQKVYLNGVLKDSIKLNTLIHSDNSSLSFGGRVADIDNYYNGVLDDIRIYNRTLSAQEIKQLYGNNCKLEVSYPNSINASLYKDLILEIASNNGATYRRNTTEKSSYTISGFSFQDTCTVRLLNKYNDTLGVISNILIQESANAVRFDSLRKIYTANLNVKDTKENALNQNISIKWFDSSNNFLLSSDSIKNVVAGKKLKYKIEPKSNFKHSLIFPDTLEYIVRNGDNNINVYLDSIKLINISGTVKGAKNNSLIEKAAISISQNIGAQNSDNQLIKSDSNGVFSAKIYACSANISVAFSGYLTKNISIDTIRADKALGDIYLSEINGATIDIGMSYTNALKAGDTLIKNDYYTNWQDLDFEIFNISKNKAIKDYQLQFPTFVILDTNAAINDSIRITATNRNKEFKSKFGAARLDSNLYANIKLDFVQNGSVQLSYSSTGNSKDAALVYDSSGKLIKQYNYSSNGSVQTDALPEGTYKIISMGYSDFFNDIQDIDDFSASGLVANTDYLLNQLNVSEGKINELNVGNIPHFNESALYYTGDGTLFSVNKTSAVVGSYFTLKTRLDFKTEYADKVSNIKLIISLPDICPLIDGSAMIGRNTDVVYTDNLGLITIPLSNDYLYSDEVRFCIIPTLSGKYKPNAFVQFDLNGKTIKQPIGIVSIEATDIEIVAPDVTAQKAISTIGIVFPSSDLIVYDNEVEVGRTKALSNGSWKLNFELNEPYSYSYHNIYAKITTPDGLEMKTATKNVTYDAAYIEVSKVTMINTAHGPYSCALMEYKTVFDFLNPSSKSASYWYWPSYPDFTFKIDFTNNDPEKITNVVLNAITAKGKEFPLKATYDQTAKCWVAASKFDSYNLPVNVSVNYSSDVEALYDRDYTNDKQAGIKKAVAGYNTAKKDIDSTYTVIDAELEKDNPNYNYIDSLSNNLGTRLNISVNDTSVDFDSVGYKKFLDSLSDKDFKAYSDSLGMEIDSTIKQSGDLIAGYDSLFKQQDFYDIALNDTSNTRMIKKTCEGINENELVGQGFTKVLTSSNTYVYYKQTETEFIFIDFEKNIYQSVSKSTKKGKIRNTILEAKGEGGFGEWINQLTEQKKKIELQFEAVKTIYELCLKKCNAKINELEYYLKYAKGIRKNCKTAEAIAKWEKIIENTESDFLIFNKLKVGLSLISSSLSIVDIIANLDEGINDIYDLKIIYYTIPDPCKCAQDQVTWLKNEAKAIGLGIATYYSVKIASDVTELVEIATGLETGGATFVAAAGQFALSAGLGWAFEEGQKQLKKNLRNDIASLHCNDCNPPIPNSDSLPPNPDGENPPTPSGNPDASNLIDPSGFVYEAVSSNLLPGVTTTCYYKSEEEDKYGDKHEVIKLWDAENYEQQNPLTTDENGFYAWDVPQGQWQVKYEKGGYNTEYSKWLPVPPPQLDVNQGMTSAVAPEVKSVLGYESKIKVEFTKYMKIDSLNTNNITLVNTKDSLLNGAVALRNEEVSPGNSELTYASKLNFVPKNDLAVGDTVILKIKSVVESYANIPMDNDYRQMIIIHAEPKEIKAPAEINLASKGKASIEVLVSPGYAAAGQILKAKSASAELAEISPSEITLDSTGSAKFEVSANLSGRAYLTFSLDKAELSAETKVNIGMPTPKLTKPKASLDSGTTLSAGTTIELSSREFNSEIYYTLDRTSPETSNSRILYSEPINLEKNTVIKAYAIKSGLINSDIATFAYTVIPVTAPSVKTLTANTITQNTAVAGGEITSNGGASITARGAVWSTSVNPTINLTTKTNDGTGSGTFTSAITSLTANTTYYYKAYAINSLDSAYGNELCFTTLSTLPIVKTTTATLITATTASSGGEITNSGIDSVTARGVVWNDNVNPTISLATKTSDGTGIGTFTSSITKLTANTTYYCKAYAVNGDGTAYGDEVTFTTLATDGIQEKSSSTMTIYPNPTNESATITFTSKSMSQGTLKIMNVMGAIVSSIDLGALQVGENTAHISMQGLAGGVYTIVVNNGNEAITGMITLAK